MDDEVECVKLADPDGSGRMLTVPRDSVAAGIAGWKDRGPIAPPHATQAVAEQMRDEMVAGLCARFALPATYLTTAGPTAADTPTVDQILDLKRSFERREPEQVIITPTLAALQAAIPLTIMERETLRTLSGIRVVVTALAGPTPRVVPASWLDNPYPPADAKADTPHVVTRPPAPGSTSNGS
jgi:hypothetical protein